MEMKNLLQTKGFTLIEYTYDKFWVLEIVPKNDDEVLNLIQKLGLNNEESIEFVCLQCDENFTKCQVMIDYNVWNLTSEEFKELIESL